MSGICGLFSSEIAAAWVTAFGAAFSAVVVAFGLAYAKRQLQTMNQQREDAVRFERARNAWRTMDDYDATKTAAGYEFSPATGIAWLSSMSDDNANIFISQRARLTPRGDVYFRAHNAFVIAHNYLAFLEDLIANDILDKKLVLTKLAATVFVYSEAVTRLGLNDGNEVFPRLRRWARPVVNPGRLEELGLDGGEG